MESATQQVYLRFTQILRDCCPPGIFAYLSNAKDSPSHQHKSIIINLACGDSVSKAQPRSELLEK